MVVYRFACDFFDLFNWRSGYCGLFLFRQIGNLRGEVKRNGAGFSGLDNLFR